MILLTDTVLAGRELNDFGRGQQRQLVNLALPDDLSQSTGPRRLHVLDWHQGWVRGEHTAPEDALVLDTKELERVERSLDGVFLPTLPRQPFNQIDSLLLLIKDFVKHEIATLKTIDPSLGST